MNDRDIDNRDNGLESEGELHDATDANADLVQDADLDAEVEAELDVEEDAPADFEALSEDDMDALVDDVERDFEGNDLDAEIELSPKEQNARALAIRRAIEERTEKRLLEESLEELDMDLDDF